jgi:DNA-binding IclR family transcriptional regulator
MKADVPREPAGIRSIETAARLLRTLAAAEAPLRLSDIAQRAGMTPSKARGYLVSLVRAGLVGQDKATSLYDLGSAALELGLAALTRLDMQKLARAAMTELAAATGETVILCVWSGRGPVVVDKIEGRRDNVYEVRIGSVVPLLQTVTGRVFMAFLPPEIWSAAADEAAHGLGWTARQREALARSLDAIAAAGVAVTAPERAPNFPAAAAPVLDHAGHLSGVITILGRAGSFAVDSGAPEVSTLQAAAARLSHRLGWSAPRAAASLR